QSVFSIPSKLDDEITIPMKFTNNKSSGAFTFEWNAIESMPQDWGFELVDYETGTTISLRDNESYTFDVAESQAKSNRTILDVASTMESDEAESRFGLVISPSTSVSTDDEIDQITEFKLEQNYPNPFNPSTTIKYAVGENGPVNITVYNVMGQKVAQLLNTTKTAGNYQVTWNAAGVSSGIYYYRLTAPGQVLTRQMTLIK
ncbi:MAG: T9SS type A sorting domain-containing protein, partial [Aliiglaciecola sp.]|uniref:T9SS type A sorting domain-containing protein n=1 Tax=Aliiglaciecola sp. TaxID=1872441 RepID=UPI003299D0E4